MDSTRKELSFLSKPLLEEILKISSISEFTKGTEILRDEQYVKVLPIVISGLVKVFSRFNEKELLLYYIEPKQSCVMSFTSALNNIPSKVFAVTEEDSKILLIPVQKLKNWLQKYPELNNLFYSQYDLRYSELLETIQHVLFDKLDKRLYEYLKQISELKHKQPIKITHSQIASELGTAREVISRIMKKLENEGKIKQIAKGILIFS